MDKQLVVATTLAVWVLDLVRGTAWQILSGQGVYYGVTFDTERCYVAARFAPYGGERAGQNNKILCLDRDLRVVQVLQPPEPIRDVHQIVQHGGTLFIVSTYDDCIVLYDIASARWERWLPFAGEGGEEPNQHHINSIHVRENQILLSGNKPAGWYARFDRERRLTGGGRQPLGEGTHNVWPEPGGVIAACSSNEGRIVTTKGPRETIHPFAWLRGVARIGEETFLGVSQNRVRDMRGSTNCSVIAIDAADRLVGCRSFLGFGMVHDLRALGVADPTHNDIVFGFRPEALARCATVYRTTDEFVDLGPPGPVFRTGAGNATPAMERTMNANGFRRVYFYHLKKCGGTSLNHWLSQQVHDDRTYDNAWLKPLDTMFLDDPQPSEEAIRLEARVGHAVFHWTDAVYSHVPLRRWAPPDALCCTMLRDPVERLVSQIADWRRFSPQDLGSLADPAATVIRDASSKPLKAFLETHARGALLFDNYLVRALAAARLGFAVKGVPKAADLVDDALDALVHSFHVVGLTARLGASANAIAERLGCAPLDDPPRLNETRSSVLLAAEIEDARAILSELTGFDQIVYERARALFDERHARQGASYNRSEFERLYAAATVQGLAALRRGASTTFSVRAPLIGSGFHGRDAAGSEQCRVWTGPAARSVLYMPVTPGAPVELQVWVHGYAAESQRERLRVLVDGAPATHRFVAQDGYRDVITVAARPARPFVALELDVGETVPAGIAGQPGSDPRLRGVSFDRYGWEPVTPA